MDWAKLLKDLRNQLLLSQVEMADLLGVSFASINRWENGHHKPNYKYQRKLKNLYKEIDSEEIWVLSFHHLI